jgi:mRNA-degrading endonuclease RelE of RelBE toxin-antitoxin system
MSNDPAQPVQLSYTPEFKRSLRHLAKKYRHIKSDIQPILDQLVGGNKLGDQISGVLYEVFKVRAKNSDALKGKSGGYRLIYQVKSPTEIVLITIYSKTEQSDVAAEESRQIILDHDAAAQIPSEGEPQADAEDSNSSQ